MIKDWKKTGINEWRKKNLMMRISQNIASKKWSVTFSSNQLRYEFLDKTFDTKIKAISFAKKYMMKH